MRKHNFGAEQMLWSMELFIGFIQGMFMFSLLILVADLFTY